MTAKVWRDYAEDTLCVSIRTDECEEAQGEVFLTVYIQKGDECSEPRLHCTLSVSDAEGRESFLVATPMEVTVFKGGDDVTVVTGALPPEGDTADEPKSDATPLGEPALTE
jgi:hypothetical protein